MPTFTEERIIQVLSNYFSQMKVPTIPRVAMRLWYYRDKQRYLRDKELFCGPEYEADLLVISASGYLKEIEIKTNIKDFRADFQKQHYHDHPEVRNFSYCLPAEVFNQHEEEITTKCDFKGAGLLLITDEEQIITKKKSVVRRYAQKLTTDAMLHYLKLAALKWCCFSYKPLVKNKITDDLDLGWGNII